MSELIPSLISALVLGLLGGGHCIGMCGGLMGALTMAIPIDNKAKRMQLLVFYNIGRISSYTIAGFVIGSLGWGVSNQGFGDSLRIIAGCLLVAMGLYLAGWWYGISHLERGGRLLWKHIEPTAKKLLPVTRSYQALLLGIAWGWLPCGLIYSTLLWAASQGNAYESGLLMLSFGIGTLPVLLITGLAAERLTYLLRKKAVRTLGGLLVILFGLWTFPGPHRTFFMGH